ncbi:MOSC domain-containing protein [Streptomyces sp. H39-S7]|uniref:MOSC domain-containing protein n=1 Tax=Streptomyces sp. H39-S7 TaxID=3004357 RepID=UPI0022AE8EA4|nr:MOSC domain-containing protein [Streptomyces sp. H39-S7]MCZ4120569.1 MOSC domain-containing protein [Streptomyces sp. H39-S7]
MARLLSLNIGRSTAVDYSDPGRTGIDKRPVEGPVAVADPGPQGVAGSGLAGDDIADRRFHGGDDQAVYAYAREDLDRWEGSLGRELRNGVFGENFTTVGVDINSALVGERWRVGEVVLEVTSPRIPCRTFAVWLGEKGWVRRFTQDARPGAYLRVVEPGEVRAGDGITVLSRPDHEVTVEFLFRALTTRAELLPRTMVAIDVINRAYAESIRKRLG